MWKQAEKFLKKDKYIKPLINKWGSCKITKSKKEMYFEDLVASIVEQQLSGKAAKAIFSRVRGVLKSVSPSPLSPILPIEVTRVSEEDLRGCGISWAKARYVKDLGEKVKRGELHLQKLDNLSDEEIISELIKVKGIGRWTAEMFLMFTLARPDVFPLDDLGIKKGFRLLTSGSENLKIRRRASGSVNFEKTAIEKMDRKEMEKFSLRWKPYRTVASWYLWRSLENV